MLAYSSGATTFSITTRRVTVSNAVNPSVDCCGEYSYTVSWRPCEIRYLVLKQLTLPWRWAIKPSEKIMKSTPEAWVPARTSFCRAALVEHSAEWASSFSLKVRLRKFWIEHFLMALNRFVNLAIKLLSIGRNQENILEVKSYNSLAKW